MSKAVAPGDQEPVTWTLARGGVAFDLTGITSAILHRLNSRRMSDSTDAATGLIAVTDAANGEITLSPNAAYWGADSSWYDLWFVVIKGGGTYRFPGGDLSSADPYYRVDIKR